jgi:hypothetical protein
MKRICLSLIVVMCSLPGAPAIAGILYGLSSSYAENQQPGALYTIDTHTGAATHVVSLPNWTSKVGLEYMNGQMYATDYVIGGSTCWLGTIDLATGA